MKGASNCNNEGGFKEPLVCFLGRGEPHDPVHCAFIKFNEGSDRFSAVTLGQYQSLGVFS